MGALDMPVIQREILRVLEEKMATYTLPLTSEELGEVLNVTPSYIREQMNTLQQVDLVGVRRGPGGGYFLLRKEGR